MTTFTDYIARMTGRYVPPPKTDDPFAEVGTGVRRAREVATAIADTVTAARRRKLERLQLKFRE